MTNVTNKQDIDILRSSLFQMGIIITAQQSKFYLLKTKQLFIRYAQELPEFIRFKYALTMAYHSQKKIYSITENINKYFKTTSNFSICQQQIMFEQIAFPRPDQSIKQAYQANLSIKDFLFYSGLFSNHLNLRWYAIHKDLLDENEPNFTIDFFCQYPREMALWQEAMHLRKLSTTDYIPLPIHPWHIKNTLVNHFSEAQHENKIIGPLIKQSAYPCFDQRYLIVKNITSPTIKSNFSLQKSNNASNIIKSLYKNLHHHKSQLIFLLEYDIFKFKHSEVKSITSFIETAYPRITQQEQCFPLNSLLNSNYLSNSPLLIGIIKQQKIAPIIFLKDIISILKSGHHLAIKHNIEIECSLEHILVVFNDKEISKIFYRDPTVNYSSVAMRNFKVYNYNLILQIINCLTNHLYDFDRNKAMSLLTPLIANQRVEKIYLKNNRNIF